MGHLLLDRQRHLLTNLQFTTFSPQKWPEIKRSFVPVRIDGGGVVPCWRGPARGDRRRGVGRVQRGDDRGGGGGGGSRRRGGRCRRGGALGRRADSVRPEES